MDQLSYYNDLEFSNNYAKYHNNDNSLICKNNVLYYNGESKIIAGNISIFAGECISLGNMVIGKLDDQIWALEPCLLYFNIRESIKLYNYSKGDIINSVMMINNLLYKDNLTQNEVNIINNFTNYYMALKTIEPYLRDNLYDYFKAININIMSDVKKANSNNVTPGVKLVYEKIFGNIVELIKDEEASSSNQNSYQRVKSQSNKPKFHNTSYMYAVEEANEKAAFVSNFIIILITLSIIVLLTAFIIF